MASLSLTFNFFITIVFCLFVLFRFILGLIYFPYTGFQFSNMRYGLHNIEVKTDMFLSKDICMYIGGGGGGGTPLYKPYRYVPPQRVWSFRRFALKMGVVFEGVYERISGVSIPKE